MDSFDFASHAALLDFTALPTSSSATAAASSSSSSPDAYPSIHPAAPAADDVASLQHHEVQPLAFPQFYVDVANRHATWPPVHFPAMDQDALNQHLHAHQHQHHPLHASSPNQLPPSQALVSAGATAPALQHRHSHHSRPSSNHSHHHHDPLALQTAGLDLDYGMMNTNWQFQLQQAAALQQQQQRQQQHQHQQQTQQPQPQFNLADAAGLDMNSFHAASYASQLQASPIDFMPHAHAENFAVSAGMDPASFMTMAGPMDSMSALVFPLNDYSNDMSLAVGLDQNALHHSSVAESVRSSLPGSSPTGTALEVQSLSDNEGWSMVSFNPHRQSLDSLAGTVSNPSQNLHIRTSSDSSNSEGLSSGELSSSFEEIAPWSLSSPHDLHGQDFLDAQYFQHTQGLALAGPHHHHHHHSPSSPSDVSPAAGPSHGYRSAASNSTSPTSSGPTSPPIRRRKSPVDGKTTKAVIKKVSQQGVRKESAAEKKVGRRRGPLRPEQRQQAHEIRKLRACLRCKFLKKTCDKGEPCGGCRPSHARLWQVPCTRMDIKDIAYFMKDWKADYERHVSLGFSVGNIKGFSSVERTLYVTHGYGHYLPINAREVFVRDDQCFGMDWVETQGSQNPEEFEISTAKLSAGMEGVSIQLLSEYLDRHLDQSFESFVDDYFEGTKFLTEILKTAYRYYVKERHPAIRKALKLMLAYNLTQHVTMVEGLPDQETCAGRIDDENSRWSGKVVAPVMINFQVKCALADMWRELQKDILEELSSLYSSVYSGEKLKNWPTIFMLAAILLAIWEEMQFDCHYRVPDEKAVNKFCEDMETTPVGVIVGLFQAISTKLPGLQEWDSRKHHQLLGSNQAVCDALTEVRSHINKHEKYLKERSTSASFNREDFDCLSNKFLSKLVIRAN